MIDPQLERQICQTLDVSAVTDIQTIQGLWSGCGQVARVHLAGHAPPTAIIKHVKMPERIRHPRGWDTDRSTQRKIRSYEVETNWYEQWAARCSADCRMPHHLGQAAWAHERLLILEDIDASGFDQRLTNVTREQLDACIRWLAAFHASFLGEPAIGLWDKGTYWHLGTRPDEYDALDEGPLKRAAHPIDASLDASPFQTILHGDAKLANFCFTENNQVAAVDYQYVGGGCGMKDLAYLVGSCLAPDECFALEEHVLETYFETLRDAQRERGTSIDAHLLEADWRRLYPFAWADFERFLQGWSPGHWKISPYSRHMTDIALRTI